MAQTTTLASYALPGRLYGSFAGKVASSGEPGAPAVRVYAVAQESRALPIARENRAYPIPSETRTLAVD